MKKNESGITLVSLVVTIIVLLILATIGANSGISTIRSAKLTKFTTELKIMQLKVNELYDSYINDGSVTVDGVEYVGDGQSDTGEAHSGIQTIGKTISQAPQQKLQEAISGSGISITSELGYMYYDADIISALGIDGVEEEFFVSIPERTVISVNGLSYQGTTYYTLDQVPNGLYNVEYNTIDGNLTFETTSEVKNGQGKIHIVNISYDKYVNKWQIRYRLKAEEGQEENPWTTTEDFTGNEFTIDVPIENLLKDYEIQVIHGNEIASEIKEAHILKIGDYVNYTYDEVASGYSLPSTESGYDSNQTIAQESGLRWRIFDVQEDGTINLISDAPTTQDVYFQGALGYNNGVLLLNDMCKELYSNSSLRIEARSINIEDIEDKMTEEALATVHEYSNAAKYGEQVSSAYTSTNYYPSIYSKETLSVINGMQNNTGLGISEQSSLIKPTDDGATNGYLKATTSIQPYQTYWFGANSFMQTAFKDAENGVNYYDLLIPEGSNTNYWVASRCVNTNPSICYFRVRSVLAGNIDARTMFDSSNIAYNSYYGFFPVISLGANIQITTVDNADGSSPENMHQISR